MCTHLQFEVVHGEGVKEESVVDLLLLLTHIHSYHCSNRGILYKIPIVQDSYCTDRNKLAVSSL